MENGTELSVFGYIRTSIEQQNQFLFVIPVDTKELCCEYLGYPLCCIAFKRNINNTNSKKNSLFSKFKSRNNHLDIARNYKQYLQSKIQSWSLYQLLDEKVDIILALFIAIGIGHIGCLMHCYEIIPEPTLNKKSPFVIASSLEGIRKAIIDIILKPTININTTNDNGFSKLMIAAQYDLIDAITILMTSNVDVNDANHNQSSLTALYIACKENNIKSIQLLLSHEKILIDKQIQDGSTALYISSRLGHLDIVQLLLNNNANPNICMHDGTSPLWIASSNGHLDIVKMLLIYG
eukprot:308684_1